MGEVVWWTGVAVWTALAGGLLWLLLTLSAEAFDATWFTARCAIEGGTKNLTPRNLLRIWFAGFWHNIYSVQAAEGYRIIYPGYGKNLSDDDEVYERIPG